MSDTETQVVIDTADKHKVAQAIYHAVTDKTEKLSRTYNQNYRVTFADLEQLNAKFEQMCTQWHVRNKNTHITIQHLDDNKETFSSLERMRAYDKSQTSPVESITFEYNILLSLPETPKPQPYKVIVRILSAVTVMKRMEDDLPPPSIFRFFAQGPVVVEVEYVDYVVARNIISTFQSWVDQIQISERSTMLRKVHRVTHWIPRISGALLLVISSIVVFGTTSQFLHEASGDLILARFLILSVTFIAASMYIGRWLGGALESSIDRVRGLSYIELNVGDTRLYKKFSKKNQTSKIMAVTSFILLTIHSIGCSLLAAYIFKLV